MQPISAALTTFGASLCLCHVSFAAVIYVDDSAIDGANDGTDWKNAYTDLKDALNIAQSGDEVRIAQGVYKPSVAGGHRDATFRLQSGVIVQGGYAGYGAAEPDALDHATYLTILSGDLNGDDVSDFANHGENSYHVVTADGVDATAILRGVTISGGSANWGGPQWDLRALGGGLIGFNGATPALYDCIIRDNLAWVGGGGIWTEAIELTRCSLIHNAAVYDGSGGALAVSGQAIVTDCLFESNKAANVSGGVKVGPWNQTLSVFRRCRFINNDAGEAGGALGGSNLRVIECEFIDNSASFKAGAFGGSHTTFVNCRFLGNHGGGFGWSGAAINSGGSVNAIGCLFSGNEAGGGAFLINSDYNIGPDSVINCTFIGNEAYCCSHGGGLSAIASTTVANCIFWGNEGDDHASPNAAQISVAHPLVLENNTIQDFDGSLGGTGNSGDDPLLIDPDGPDDIYGTEDDNARLSDNSPCRDEGNNSFLPPDQFDLDGDGNTTEPIPLDLDLLPRVVNGVVDIGAFEHQAIACIADLEPDTEGGGGDNIVNVLDLLAVINSWGSCDPLLPCLADINNDGNVNVLDLLAVIAAWGPCPV